MTHEFPKEKSEIDQTSKTGKFLAGAALRGACAIPALIAVDKLAEKMGGDFVTNPIQSTVVVAALATTGGLRRIKSNKS